MAGRGRAWQGVAGSGREWQEVAGGRAGNTAIVSSMWRSRSRCRCGCGCGIKNRNRCRRRRRRRRSSRWSSSHTKHAVVMYSCLV